MLHTEKKVLWLVAILSNAISVTLCWISLTRNIPKCLNTGPEPKMTAFKNMLFISFKGMTFYFSGCVLLNESHFMKQNLDCSQRSFDARELI